MDILATGTEHRRAPAHPLDDRILDFMRDGDDAGFERLALDVFHYQYEACPPYRRYCERCGVTPATASGWRDVPAVPAASFAEVRLACFDAVRTTIAFESSGTTGARRSTHELETTALYDESLWRHFGRRLGLGYSFLAIMPSPAEAPRSSLSYMLGELMRRSAGGLHAFGVRGGSLDLDACAAWLAALAGPACVFAPAFGFVHFLDACRERGVRFALPPGSAVVETGGLKGRARDIPRDELYAELVRCFEVPRERCISEYGMCELGSQWYDGVGARWTRWLVVDPVSGEPVRAGEAGLLRVFDLANRGSVCAVLTADLAKAGDGQGNISNGPTTAFTLLGRYAGAPPKGCSIALDAMLSR